MTFAPLTSCPNECGSRIDPTSMPGGICHDCFRALDPAEQRRLIAEHRRAYPTDTQGGPKNHGTERPRHPALAPFSPRSQKSRGRGV
jgi:hypothetical protein